MLICLAFEMLTSIEFDNQSGFQAGEINYKTSKARLTLELVTVQPVPTQVRPKFDLRIGLSCA